MFDKVYRHICQSISDPRRAGNSVDEAFDAIQIGNAIEHDFCQRVCEIHNGLISAAAAHKNTLFNFRKYWADLRSITTCFACLARKPEHTLRCGHTLCDACIVIHGTAPTATPWTLTIKTCPLCNLGSNNVIKLKPPTAGVRVLSIDGGGIRGITSIAWLKELQSILRLPMPVQEHFDMAVGTSSGTFYLLASQVITDLP